jgi:hypothetical protein
VGALFEFFGAVNQEVSVLLSFIRLSFHPVCVWHDVAGGNWLYQWH